MAKKALGKRQTQRAMRDDFKSVARRLGCDDDKDRFEARLAQLANVKVKSGTISKRKK
jgi:hypothetical protein